MTWHALQDLVELGWSQEREDAVLAERMTTELVEEHLDLLTAVTPTPTAVRAISAALAVVDQQTATGVRLRLQLGVLAVDDGRFADAWSILRDAYIDAGRIGSRWVAAAFRANLAAVALHQGDIRAAQRLLTRSTETGAPDVLMASVRAALVKTDESVEHQRWVLDQYRIQAGSSSPTALVAAATVELNQFHLALAADRAEKAKQLLDQLEFTVQRVSAALGADHPQTLTVRLNHATADFRLARSKRSHDEMIRATTVLRAATQKLEAQLGASHHQSLVARGTLVAAEFDVARRNKSAAGAVAAFQGMRAVLTQIAQVFGDQHPHSLTALVNVATAGFELVRAGSGELSAETALQTLEKAYDRADAVLGTNHGTTRVLFHELTLCRQWMFGGEDEGGSGDGTVRTRQRTETGAVYRRPEPFDREYISLEQAAQLLLRPRTILLDEDPRAEVIKNAESALEGTPVITPQCCGPTPPLMMPSVPTGDIEHDPTCPNHPDNRPNTDVID